MDTSFYQRSIFSSYYFRANTSVLVIALGFGGYCALMLSRRVFVPLWLYVVAVMLGLVVAWGSAIREHSLIRKRIANDPDGVSREELLKLAAFWPTSGLIFTYLIAMTLLFCLAEVIKHYEGFVSAVRIPGS
jgi:hypothetical protein